MIDNSDFEACVLKEAPASYDPRRFPIIYQDENGDCIEVYASDEPFFGERIDGRVTIYRGQESGDVVGVMVKGVKTWLSRILNEYPGFRLEIDDSGNGICLGVLFYFQQLKETDPKLQMQYKKLRSVGATWRIQTGNLPIPSDCGALLPN